MTGHTPLYSIPYLVGSDPAKQIAQVSEDQAVAIEALLLNKGMPPLDSELVDLIQRMSALETTMATVLATFPRWIRGSFTVPAMGSNASSYRATVDFSAAGFAEAPALIPLPQYARYSAVSANISAQSGTIDVRNNSNGAGIGDTTCQWLAFGL